MTNTVLVFKKNQASVATLRTKSIGIRLMRSIMLLALMMCAALPGKAQTYYVFYNATAGYIYRNGNNPGVTTDFTKDAIWVASGALGGTTRNIYSYTATTRFLRGGTNGTSVTLGNSTTTWRLRDNVLNYNNNRSGYVHYNGSTLVCSDGNTRFTPYAITINSNTVSNPTISITAASGLSNGGIQLTGNVTGSYIPANSYYYATVRNYNNNTQIYYWTTTTDATTTQPTGITDWSDATKTWAVTTGGAYASVSNDGLVTITGNPTGNVVVTLTVSKGGYTGTQTFTLTRAAAVQATNTVVTINSLSVSPSSAALYVSESQAFTASATVNSTTYTTPAHTTLTNGGDIYRYYNGSLYTNTEDFSSSNSTTATPTYAWSISGAGSGNASLSTTSGASTTVTHTPGADADKGLTLTVEASYTGATPQTRSVQVNLYAPFVAPTITRSGNNISLSTVSLGATIYYTTDGSTPSASNGTAYTGPFSLEELSLPVTVKAIAVRNAESTPVAQQTYNTLATEKPVISISSAGAVTITCATAGASIRYTTDGTDPTSSTGTVFNGSFNVANLATVKAIAYKDGYAESEVVSETYITSGISGTMVILDDREDHSWSYYSDASTPEQLHSLNPADVKITYYGNGIVMTGNADYTASSTDFVQPGNANYVGGAKVNVGGENENTFVYYKTLERGANTDDTWTFSSGNQSSAASRCPYTPIPNPFQVRPTYGGTETTNTADWTGWRGFQCWRLKSVSGGAVYSAASGGTALATGAVINAEDEIYFAPNTEYGMEVQLEAVWAIAYVVKASDDENAIGDHSNVGYERNFIILNSYSSNQNVYYNFGGTTGKRITNIDRQVTVSRYLPNGVRGQNNDATYVRGAGGTNMTLQANTKFENVAFYDMSSYSITAANNDVIIGRGCTGTVNLLQGISGGATDLDYTMRIETGTINQLAFIRDAGTNASYTVSGTVMVKAILGCDYDRATNTNTNLSVSANNTFFFDRAGAFSSAVNKDKKVFDCVVKSGEYQKGFWTSDETNFTYTNSMYCGHNFNATTNTHYPGARYVTIEGGQLGNINGGRGTGAAGDNDHPDATTGQTDAWKIAFSLRIRNNAVINGCVFGGAANTSAWGSKRIVVTGGKVRSWIAGGANGTNTTNGDSRTRGTSYIYVGGNAIVGGPDALRKNSTYGGQIFGAGRGNTNQAASMDTSQIVIADNAQILKKDGEATGNVYGGGNIGYTHKQSNIYILGGTIEGSVYGGAYSNALQIPEVNITMRGGLVEGGVYGGSNNSGTISGNVTMHIDGGQVGTSSVNANVHGGGLGNGTSVNGNVDLNLGTCGAASGATIYGDVYGGSALGTVNTNANNTTSVSLYKGTIYGGLYGGALGDAASLGAGHSNVAAAVNGKVAVKVMGGSVLCSASDPDGEAGTGSVFGCNNVNGTPASTVTVDIYNTDQPLSGYALHAVYGGGNKSAYTGTPVVNIHGCGNSIEYVYGGGNAADVAGTNVTIWGGIIGNAFAGGNGFSAANPPNHNNPSAAHYNPGADITSSGTHLTIHGGTIGAAFGGSNQYGTITGGVNVDVIDDSETGNDPCGNPFSSCPMDIAELYGGGNEAPLISSRPSTYIGQNDIHVNLDCSAKVGMLFGGAKKADYVGNINLVVNGGTFNKVFGGNNQGGTITGNVTVTFNGGSANEVYGGCNEDGDITGTIIVNIDSTNSTCTPPFWVGNVYGGGNEAAYSHSAGYPEVNIINGTVRQNVYGGGFGSTAVVTGTPKVTIGVSDANKKASVLGNVFGGGNAAGITGSTDVNVISNSTVMGNVFGGGNEAPVSANTHVWIRDRVRVYGNIYGGGNRGEIGGDTKVIVNGE